MKVVVEERLFGLTWMSPHLTALLLVGAVEWGHRVVIDYAPDDPGAVFEGWLAGHEAEVAGEIRLTIELWDAEEADPTRGGWPEAEVDLTDGPSDWTPAGGGPPRLSVTDVFRVLRRPFEIHVEDDTTDRAFLLSIAPEHIRTTVLAAEARGELVFFNGGGVSNMKRRLQPLTDAVCGVAGLVRRRRMWLMVDSDARRPAGLEGRVHRSRPVADLVGVCRRLMGPDGVWPLARRFVESYLPTERLKTYAEGEGRSPVYEAWGALDDGHRHTFNMKSGLSQDRRHAKWGARFAAHWEAMPSALDEGFGPHVAELYVDCDITHDEFDAEARAEAAHHLGRLMRRL